MSPRRIRPATAAALSVLSALAVLGAVPSLSAREMPMPCHLAAPTASCCPVVELRQYTLQSGQRDRLIELFEREFIESQEMLGITLIGQFYDLDNPDRFVWLRGFPDMAARADALTAFYGGPVWQKHRRAANATMVDSDNVLLLRPARRGGSFALHEAARAPRDLHTARSAILVATIYYFDDAVEESFGTFFANSITPALIDAGAELLATFETEAAANNFPRLPVREGEHVFVSFARFDDQAAHERHLITLAGMTQWPPLSMAIRQHVRRTETLRLAPTARSLLPVARTAS